MNFKNYIKENNKLAGLISFNNSNQFKISQDPNFIKIGFEALGSVPATLNELKSKFGEPQNINISQQYLSQYSGGGQVYTAYWALEFKDGLKVLITPGTHSIANDYLLKGIRAPTEYDPNYDVPSSKQRWYFFVPRDKVETISKEQVENRLKFILKTLEENNKLNALKMYTDRLSFQKGKLRSWLADPNRYGFQIEGGADEDLEISYADLVRKFGRPSYINYDKEGEGAIYYWGIEFKDGLKIIITQVFYYDPDNGIVDMGGKFTPGFWEYYVAPFSEENLQTVKERLEDILRIKL